MQPAKVNMKLCYIVTTAGKGGSKPNGTLIIKRCMSITPPTGIFIPINFRMRIPKR